MVTILVFWLCSYIDICIVWRFSKGSAHHCPHHVCLRFRLNNLLSVLQVSQAQNYKVSTCCLVKSFSFFFPYCPVRSFGIPLHEEFILLSKAALSPFQTIFYFYY